ncbi:hypothetical protein J6590_029810 [Homalodisca vitripennis]|nr:hypothetical protein J6590_029810 [Homalodisca vitripennis]
MIQAGIVVLMSERPNKRSCKSNSANISSAFFLKASIDSPNLREQAKKTEALRRETNREDTVCAVIYCKE